VLIVNESDQFQAGVALCAASEDPAFALADLNRLLSRLGPVELRRAVALRPATALSDFCANYVAAMVELACARSEIELPAWTREVPPLATPWFGSELLSLRLHLLCHSPPPFRCRNIYVDGTLGAQV
jgi:hypothetical protein